MERMSPGRMAHDLFQKPARPIPVVIAGTRSDEGQFLSILGNPCRISAKLHGIFLRRKISAATPRLVPDAPIAHSEGLGVSCRGAHIRQGRTTRGRIAIFHPAIKFGRRKTANIGRKIRLASNQLAELDELVGPKLIGIIFVAGRTPSALVLGPEVSPPGTLVYRPDAITPVVAVGKASAGIADDRAL